MPGYTTGYITKATIHKRTFQQSGNSSHLGPDRMAWLIVQLMLASTDSQKHRAEKLNPCFHIFNGRIRTQYAHSHTYTHICSSLITNRGCIEKMTSWQSCQKKCHKFINERHLNDSQPLASFSQDT